MAFNGLGFMTGTCFSPNIGGIPSSSGTMWTSSRTPSRALLYFPNPAGKPEGVYILTYQDARGTASKCRYLFASHGIYHGKGFSILWLQESGSSLLLAPGAIVNASTLGQDLMAGTQVLHFSFTTLAAGLAGTAVPVHAIVRSLANIESLMGQLYPVILIGRLVSLGGSQNQK